MNQPPSSADITTEPGSPAPSDTTQSGNPERAILEQRAEKLRSRLFKRLSALDERGARLRDVVGEASAATRRLAPWLVGAAVAAGVLSYSVRRLKTRRRDDLRHEVLRLALSSAPGEEGRQLAQPGVLGQAIKRASLGLLVGLAQRLAARALLRLAERQTRPALPAASRSRVAQ